jgi:hypothetical protein
MSESINAIPRWLWVTILISKFFATLVAVFLIFIFAAYAFNSQDSGISWPGGGVQFLMGLCIGYLIAWKWMIFGGVAGLVCLVFSLKWELILHQ